LWVLRDHPGLSSYPHPWLMPGFWSFPTVSMGIAPITGIPAPFLSVGGSSMIANLVAMGVLLAIYARGRERRQS
jgi:cell division protein FtsW (lipid II flippase)